MTLEEFDSYLKTIPLETQLVYIRYKYSWEDEWAYENQLLCLDMNIDGFYVWQSDWNEGQEDVEVLGCVALSDVEVKTFKR